MKAVIVGNGLTGTLAAKTLRELDREIEIVIFAEEDYPYYPRPNLIEFLAGRIPLERLYAFPEGWNVQQNIDVHLGEKVIEIEPKARTVKTSARRDALYDVLLLAGGSRPMVPPIQGKDKKGFFVLKTLDDAQSVLGYLKDHPRVAILGGGLLGLEIARALKSQGAGVLVVEFFDRLLPRQLDGAGASILQGQIEKMGIEVRCGAVTEEILGGDAASGLKFKDGSTVEADMIVCASGVIPDTDMAKSCGLDVNKGILVDDRLRTSQPDIFAAGDVAEHRNRIYGLIPAAFEQSRIAAYNMLGMEKIYEGTLLSNTLKVVGLQVTSVGEINPEGDGYEALSRQLPEEGIYKKLVLKDGIVCGAIWMGTKKGVAEISRLVSKGIQVDRWREDLLEDNFDFSDILQ